MTKKINIFTGMMIVATFAIVLRLLDLSNFSTPSSVAESSTPAEKFESVSGNAPPAPPPVITIPEGNVPPPASSVYGEHAYSAAELDVLQSLSKRRDELDKREQQIAQHEALLKAAEGEVDRKIAELNKLRKELVDLLNKQQSVQDERVNSLVKIYESMKPKEAARIFDTLDMDVLLAVIGKMSERKSSPILASMDPEKARIVTIKLSEQHKLPDLQRDGQKNNAAPVTTPVPTTPN